MSDSTIPLPDERSRAALRFGITASVLSLLAFAAIRLRFVEVWFLEPLTACQYQIAVAWLGSPPRGMVVNLSCSGGDLLALCLAMTLAYPVAWRRRLLGAALGVVLVLTLNTLRITTLGQVAGTRFFPLLHVYIWPAALVVLTLAYVGTWMWWADSGGLSLRRARLLAPRIRMVAILAAGVGAYLVLKPWLESLGVVHAWANVVAQATAVVLNGLGIESSTGSGLLRTVRGSYLITPECVTTPLMPLYLASLAALPLTWKRRAIGVALFLPIFGVLAVARLLTLALPRVLVATPIFLTHGFHQILMGVFLVAAACFLARAAHARPWAKRAALVAAGAVGAALVLARLYTWLLTSGASLLTGLAPHTIVTLVRPGETQGEWLLFPAFQALLLVALWIAVFGWRYGRLFALCALAVYIGQIAMLVGAGEMREHYRVGPHALTVRAWAVAAPVLIVLAVYFRKRRGAAGSGLLGHADDQVAEAPLHA